MHLSDAIQNGLKCLRFEFVAIKLLSAKLTSYFVQ